MGLNSIGPNVLLSTKQNTDYMKQRFVFFKDYSHYFHNNVNIFGVTTYSLFRARIPKHADVALTISHGDDSFLGVDVNGRDIGILCLLRMPNP